MKCNEKLQFFFLFMHKSEDCVNDWKKKMPVFSFLFQSQSLSAPLRPRRKPCEIDFEMIKLISNGAYG